MFLIFNPFSGASGDMILAALERTYAHLSPDDHDQMLNELSQFTAKVSGDLASISFRQDMKGPFNFAFADVRAKEAASHTHWSEIRDRLTKLESQYPCLSDAKGVFELIARAEASAHGVETDDVHFHEVGAADSIADICCSAWLLDRLRAKGLQELYSMPVGCGKGTVSGSHGVMSNPAPATLEVFAGSQFSLVHRETEQELVTPTAAAILVYHCQPLPQNLSFSLEAVFRSAGTREWTDIPSYLETRLAKSVLTPRDRVSLLECNVDDMTGEELEELADSLISAGALDAWLENVLAKKGRPAYKICVLAHPASAEQFSQMICRLTTTIGVRYTELDRYTLPRRTVTVKTDYGDVRVKVSGDGNTAVKPEMSDVKRIAREMGLPLVEVRRSIEAQVHRHLNT